MASNLAAGVRQTHRNFAIDAILPRMLDLGRSMWQPPRLFAQLALCTTSFMRTWKVNMEDDIQLELQQKIDTLERMNKLLEEGLHQANGCGSV